MSDGARTWTFLSNYAHVLVCLAANPDARVHDIATEVGITERRVTGILNDLAQAGIITVLRTGRRNRYTIDSKARLRHPLETHKTVGDLLNGVL